MHHLLRRLRGVLIAITALALSAGLAFAANPDAATWGRTNASAHAGKVVPVRAGWQDEVDEPEDADEDVDEETEEETEETEEATEETEETVEEEVEEDGGNCSTDPTTLTDEELAELNHGSIVCWAAHQKTWPEEFKNHGQWVRSWAQQHKNDDEDSTEEGAGAASAGKAHGQGHGRGKGHNR